MNTSDLVYYLGIAFSSGIYLGLVSAIIARKKGRSLYLWWLYGAIIPPIAIIHSLIIKPSIEIDEQEKLSHGGKKCPFCAEIIKAEAIVCRHCNKDQPEIKLAVEKTSQSNTLPNPFTIIEISKIIIIILVLGYGSSYITRTIMQNEARIRTSKFNAEMNIKNLQTALKLYKLDNGNYPTTEQGLIALVQKPTTGKIPKDYKVGTYLENNNVPKDPWGNEYVYKCPGDHGDIDLLSYGADKVKGGEGENADITSWNLDKN